MIRNNEQKFVCLLPKKLVKNDKTAFFVSKGILRRIFLSTKFQFFSNTRWHWTQKIGFGQKFSGMAVKTSFYMFKRIFWRHFFWKKSCIHFLMTLTKNFVLQTKWLRKSYQNIRQTLRRVIPTRNIVLSENNVFIHFRTLIRNFLILCQIFSGVLWKLLSICPEDTFQEYICSKRFCFFSLVFGIFQKFVVILSKKFGKVATTGF